VNAFAWAYLASAVVCSALGVVAWRHRAATSAAGALAVCMAGLTWWSSVDVWASLTADPLTTVSRQLWIYPGVGAVVAGFACLGWSLVDPAWRPTRRLLVLLSVEPTLLFVLALTNDAHSLVVRPLADGPEPVEFGTAFWVHAAYSYAVMGTALVHVLRERRHAPAMRTRQLTLLLAGSVIPTAGNVLTLSGLVGMRDVSALCFVATGLLNAYAVLRHGLFTVVPIARAQVLEGLSHAVVVLDEQERLADVNAAAVGLLRRAAPVAARGSGVPAREALGSLADLLLGESGEHEVALPGGPVWLDVRVSPLHDRHGRSLGRVVVVHDVTAETEQRHRLAEANAVLVEQVEVIERLRAEVAEQAVRDHLTGLHNRRHLSRLLDEHLEHVLACGSQLSIGLLDVDHFKAVNDAHGHGVGDRVLQAVAARLQAAAQPGETVARVGGEEFVLLLPGVGRGAALARVEQVRRSCAVDVPVRGGGGHDRVQVTLSAGVASAGADTATERALTEAADRGLYRAKAGGRDRAEDDALHV
jgi:diguanylate cyclase (GGDEF)-like protein